MTALLVCWAAFPALLALLAQGCGTLVQRLAGRHLALGVRIPCGVALVIAVLDLATRTSATARLGVPAVLALGALGLVLAPPWRWRLRPAAPALAAAGVVFAVYAAPVVLSGMATWTGYIKLDDTATWLALVDRALTHGRTLAGLPPSSYRATLSSYLTVGYPLGSFLPLGIGHTVLGEDDAWLVNPWMAFMAATLALALHRIAALSLGQPAGAAVACTRRPGPADRTTTSSDEHSGRAGSGGKRMPLWVPAAIAALAAQPALLYGYYLWGGIKEVAGALLIGAFAVAAPLALGGERRLRALIPGAVVVWALISAQSPGGLVWVAPGVLVGGALWLFADGGVCARVRARARAGAHTASFDHQPLAFDRQTPPLAPGHGPARESPTLTPPRPVPTEPRPRSLRPAAALATTAAAVAGGLYLVLRPGGFVERFHNVLTGGHELGNLATPLSFAQVAGIWPTGDFRFAPSAGALTDALIGLAVLCAAAGVLLALRKRRHELVLYVACALTGALLVDLVAAPWLGAKALASASPAIPLAALTALAIAWQHLGALGPRHGPGKDLPGAAYPADRATVEDRPDTRGRRRGSGRAGALSLAAPLAGCAIAFAIGWSNVLAYHDVNLAPRAQFAELAQIGQRIAGDGPTLITEYQPYAARHFLREAAPEGVSELREREDQLISGTVLEKGQSADIDQIQLRSVLAYRTLVLQRSPVTSRPPSPYRLTLTDAFWEVWQRPPRPRPTVLWHLPLGNPTEPGSVPDCSTLLGLASRGNVRRVIGAPVENPLVAPLRIGSYPAAWATGDEQLAPRGSGSASLTLAVPRAGRYAVWLGGSTRGPLSIAIDGRPVGTALLDIQEPGQYIRFGSTRLDAGPHTVLLRHGSSLWRPGTGGPPEAIGPLVLSRLAPRPPLLALPANRARELCGRTLDWVEGVG